MSQGLAVGVDIGGTKLAAGLVAADGSVLARAREETPAAEVDAITDLVVTVARRLSEPYDVDCLPVGVGAAGLIDVHGAVRYAPNVDWRAYPLREELRQRLGAPVTVDNDANVAAWGEFRVGAGATVDTSMLMLTLGTGVGGGLVIGGELVRGAAGFGAEFGHIVVDEGGPLCSCGNRGCLEALASGNAIGRIAREALDAGTVPSSSRLHRLAPVTGKSVTVAAHAGDEAATAILARCGFWLGVGIASLVNALDPEVVVIGGGAMQAGELLLGPAEQTYHERLVGRAYRPTPPVVSAQLGDDAGLVGAALLALETEQRSTAGVGGA